MRMQQPATAVFQTASTETKTAIIAILSTLAAIDGIKPAEVEFIKSIAAKLNIPLEKSFFTHSPQTCIELAKKIQNRALALDLIKDMFILAYTDETFSDLEGEFICCIGNALNVKPHKIKEISDWVIDRIIWLEQGSLIFEKKRF